MPLKMLGILPLVMSADEALIYSTFTTDEDLIKYGFPEDVWYAFV